MHVDPHHAQIIRVLLEQVGDGRRHQLANEIVERTELNEDHLWFSRAGPNVQRPNAIKAANFHRHASVPIRRHAAVDLAAGYSGCKHRFCLAQFFFYEQAQRLCRGHGVKVVPCDVVQYLGSSPEFVGVEGEGLRG